MVQNAKKVAMNPDDQMAISRWRQSNNAVSAAVTYSFMDCFLQLFWMVVFYTAFLINFWWFLYYLVNFSWWQPLDKFEEQLWFTQKMNQLYHLCQTCLKCHWMVRFLLFLFLLIYLIFKLGFFLLSNLYRSTKFTLIFFYECSYVRLLIFIKNII